MYSTTRSQPRISAMLSPLFSVAGDRLYDAAEELCRLVDPPLERGERGVVPRPRKLVRERERGLVEGDLRPGDLGLERGDEIPDRCRRATEAEDVRPVRW